MIQQITFRDETLQFIILSKQKIAKMDAFFKIFA